MTSLKTPFRTATIPSPTDLLAGLAGGAAALFAKLRQHQAQAQTRALVREMSEAQCRDMGIDATRLGPARPVIAVPAGLMARLESMR